MQLAKFITSAIERLKQAGIDNPSLDARLLIGHALGMDRASLLSQSARILNDSDIRAINVLLDRRIAREPVARIIGQREFWGLPFGLNEATLDPRPDSETLIEAVLSSVREQRGPHANVRILDLGTGTGCLLLALLHELPDATGLGIDINPRAALQAAQNAAALGLSARATFQTGNWFSPLCPPPRGEGQGGGSAATTALDKFDVIISNPPYIPAADIPALMPEVRDYDPMLALDGGEDGLAPYRFLIPQMKEFLNPHGLVAFEVGQGQAAQVAELLHEHGFENIAKHKDLGGVERCVTASATITAYIS